MALTAVGNLLYFSAGDGVAADELWRTDGTAAGTVLVASVAPGTTDSSDRGYPDGPISGFQGARVGAEVLFLASDGNPGETLWKTDGTAAGTAPADLFGASNPALFPGPVAFGGEFYVSAGSRLYKTDGTAAGTAAVGAPFDSEPEDLTAIGKTLYFISGTELWASDGATNTEVATNLSDIRDMTAFGGLMYFTADDATGTGLYRTDGTAAGTGEFAHLSIDDPTTEQLAVAGGLLYFDQFDAAHGDELWATDGTSGAYLVSDIDPGPASSNPSQLTALGNTLFFSADDGVHGEQLWVTDGTAAGSTLVKNINPAVDSTGKAVGSNPLALCAFNGVLFFYADDGLHGSEPWTSDGTAAGTALLKDINPGAGGSGTSPTANDNQEVLIGGRLFFDADDGTHGNELWESDGTAAGTAPVADINPGAGGSFTEAVAVLPTGLLAFGDDGVHGSEPLLITGADLADPALAPIPDQLIAAQSRLSLTASATEVDATFTYSLAPGAPAGASIDPATGLFTFTPAAGPATDSVTVLAADDFGQVASETFRVDVLAAPAPVLAPIADRSVDEGGSLILTASAVEPGATITYSLAPGTTPFASIDPQTGLFQFNASGSTGPSTATITVIAADDSGRTASQAFRVDVLNVAPVVSGFVDATATAGLVFSDVGSIRVSGTGHTLTGTVDFGDGTGPLALDPDGFVLGHTYAAAGTYAVTVVVAEETGLAGSEPFRVTVLPPPATLGTLVLTEARGAISEVSWKVSTDLDRADAADLGNYALLPGRATRRRGIVYGKAVPLSRAVYDPATKTLTLTLRHKVAVGGLYRLTIRSAGLRDALGRPLDGGHQGIAGGSNYTAIIRKGVVAPSRAVAPDRSAARGFDHLAALGQLPEVRSSTHHAARARR